MVVFTGESVLGAVAVSPTFSRSTSTTQYVFLGERDQDRQTGRRDGRETKKETDKQTERIEAGGAWFKAEMTVKQQIHVFQYVYDVHTGIYNNLPGNACARRAATARGGIDETENERQTNKTDRAEAEGARSDTEMTATGPYTAVVLVMILTAAMCRLLVLGDERSGGKTTSFTVICTYSNLPGTLLVQSVPAGCVATAGGKHRRAREVRRQYKQNPRPCNTKRNTTREGPS